MNGEHLQAGEVAAAQPDQSTRELDHVCSIVEFIIAVRRGRGGADFPVAGRDYGVPSPEEMRRSFEIQRQEDPEGFQQFSNNLNDFFTHVLRELHEVAMWEDATHCGP